MSHPMQEHREHKVSRSRVAHIARGYATGGAVHEDAAEDAAMIKAKVKPSALKSRGGKIEGKSAMARLDRPGRQRRKAGGPVTPEPGSYINVGGNTLKVPAGGPSRIPIDQLKTAPSQRSGGRVKRASGGRVGKKKGATTVNVIVSPHPGGATQPPAPAGIGAAASPPAPPSRPPMPMAGPGMPPGAMPSGGPPMMRARGGRISDGPAWKEGLRNGTKVQPSSDKGMETAQGAAMKRERKTYNYRTGGKVKGVSVDEKPPIKVGEMGLSGTKEASSPFPKMKHASGGGMGRLEKAKKAVRGVSAP